MIKAKPLAFAVKIKNIIDICEGADAIIAEQALIKKGALDAGKDDDGIEPSVVRTILAQRKKRAKDPVEAERIEELADHYKFLLGEGRADTRPWTQADDEMSRVMALTNTDKPPKIEAIKKALGCSQGKAQKLRAMAAARLAAKSSSSFARNEHEHSETTDGPPSGAAAGTTVKPGSPGSAAPTQHADREVDPPGAHAGERSEPSRPAAQAVNADPPLGASAPIIYTAKGGDPAINHLTGHEPGEGDEDDEGTGQGGGHCEADPGSARQPEEEHGILPARSSRDPEGAGEVRRAAAPEAGQGPSAEAEAPQGQVATTTQGDEDAAARADRGRSNAGMAGKASVGEMLAADDGLPGDLGHLDRGLSDDRASAAAVQSGQSDREAVAPPIASPEGPRPAPPATACGQDQAVDLNDPVALDALRVRDESRFATLMASRDDAGAIPAELDRRQKVPA